MKKGFTLAEAMGVIILIGLLALVTVPFVEDYINNSKNKAYNANVTKIIEAARNWNMKYGYKKTFNNGSYCLTLEELKNTEFLADQDISSIIATNEDNEFLNGSVLITKNNNSYKYEYKDNGCDNNE